LAPSPTPFATPLATPFARLDFAGLLAPFAWLDFAWLLAPFDRDFVAVALRPLDLRVDLAFPLLVFALDVLEALDFFAGLAFVAFV
jgi:hypothetical protein